MENQLKKRLEELAPSQETIQENFDNVELSEDEVDSAIHEAKRSKFYRLKQEEWLRKIREKPVWFTPSAYHFYEFLLKTKSKSGEPYQVTEWNRPVIEFLCKYFAGEEDTTKGILLMGKPGTGKTHLMNFFAKNPKASYSLPTCKTIAELYSKNWTSNDMTAIEHYSVNKKAEVGHMWDQTELGYCFGDLGSESSSVKSYGNERNVMEEIVFNRYESGLPFFYTHFTTNLNAEELEKKYGSRFRDRIREMCHVQTLEGNSFR